MVSIDDLKDLVLYKKNFFLPINMKDKSHGSAIMLLTPNYQSSILCMTSPYVINKRYFMSYYIEKAVLKIIQNESVLPTHEKGEYLFETSLSTEERKDLSDSEFGIPELRKYPLNDKKHVLMAIRFFNYVEDKYEQELANNIIARVKKLNMASEVHVGKKNRFKYYWDKSGLNTSEISESTIEITLLEEESYINDIRKEIPHQDFSTVSLPHVNDKFSKYDNITFSGYKSDINEVSKFVKRENVEKCFTKMNKKYPKYNINIVCISDTSIPESFDDSHVIIYTPNAFKSFKYKFSYKQYIAYTLQLFAIYTLKSSTLINKNNGKVYDSLAEPAAILLSGIADTEITNSPNNQFQMEKIFKYIIQKEGIDRFIEILSSNDIDTIIEYGKMLGMERSKDRSFYEYYQFIKEEQDNQSSVDDTPESLKKLKNMKTSIKRKVRNASVYKLNRLKSDMEDSLNKSKAISVSEDFRAYNLEALSEQEYLQIENYIYLFEDSKFDARLRKALFKDRFRSDREVLQVYEKVKRDLPFIKYAYTKFERYGRRNVFIDNSYYNESFFSNIQNLNSDTKANTSQIFKLYLELLERLVKNENFGNYSKKTIFIPVLDWNHNLSTKMWIYREDINPISAIYHMMRYDKNTLLRVFGDKDVVFMGSKNYFKINFNRIDMSQDSNRQRFLMLIKRIITLGYNSPADPDPEESSENSPKGIAMSIVDKVETSKNIDINDVSKIEDLPTDAKLFNINKPEPVNPATIAIKKNIVSAVSSNPIKDNVVGTSKEKDYSNSIRGKVVSVKKIERTEDTTQTDSDKDFNKDTEAIVNKVDDKTKKDNIVDAIAKASSTATDEDDALNNLDNDSFKAMIEDIENDSVDNVRVSTSKASPVIEVQSEFYKKQVNNKSVKDLLSRDMSAELKETSLPIASINDEWNHLTFTNFDKDYDLDADIIKMLDSMKDWTYPVGVLNIDVQDNSTQDDILDLWTIECIDSFKRKFTIRVDIPKFINGSNFLKLRGNEKTLMIQSANLPISKSRDNECQIISTGGYNKIFVRKYGGRKGQSMPAASKLIRALNKYVKTYTDIKVQTGNNVKICTKYELPIDYIDLAQIFNTIESKKYKFFFNQDEFRNTYKVDDSVGIPICISFGDLTDEDIGKGEKYESILYYDGTQTNCISSLIASLLCEEDENFRKIYYGISVAGNRFTYSKASILDIDIPIVLICSYLEGLIPTMKKAGIKYSFEETLSPDIRHSDIYDYIKFSDGYLIYNVDYASSMLMNGLKEFGTDEYSLKDINNRKMYLDFLNILGNIKSDGIENSYDCMIDPITKEILEKFKLPTDYVSILCYTSSLLCDNKFTRHIDQAGRRWRRKEVIAGYFYKALTSAYQEYANNNRRSRKSVKMSMKQSAIIDLMISKDPSTSDLSFNNALNDVECINTITNKGLVGMNVARGYTLSTRGYDPSMINLLGMDTGFSNTVGVNRQATINASIEGGRGFIKVANTEKLSTVSTLTITEAVTPFGVTHDDPQRTLMTYVQTSKHTIRCFHNDPSLVTTGADEALPYLCSDIFAYKAKKDGKIVELVQEGFNGKNYMVIQYVDGKYEYINLNEEVKKNSDGGYFIPLKLDTDFKLGQKFKEGNILAYDRSSFSNSLGESGNISVNIGTLCKIAILNSDEAFEDACILTEEFAQKLSSYVIMDVTTNVSKGSNIMVYKNIGDHVMEGDTLFTMQEDFEDDVVTSLLKNLTLDMDALSELGSKPVRTKYTGFVQDIKIYRTCELEDMTPSLRAFVLEHEDKITEVKDIYDKYGIDKAILPPTDKVPEIGKTKNLRDGVMIIYYINHEDKMGVASKISFYSANKGVVKGIVPLNKEPYTQSRPKEHIGSIMSLSSISGRMTCSITIMTAIGKLMVELDRTIKDIAGIPYDENVL